MSDPFSIFDQRVSRRLAEMREAAAGEFKALASQMAMSGRAGSGAEIRGQLDIVKDHLEKAIDWALSEAKHLPGQAGITRMHMTPRIQANLLLHLDGLFAGVRGMETSPAVQNLVLEQRSKLKAQLEGEMSEFQAGLWHPRKTSHEPTSTTPSISIQNSRGVIIQQAGSGSTQTATLSTIDNAIAELLSALDRADVADELKREVCAEVETIRVQSQRANPNKAVVIAAAEGLKALTYGVAGNLLTPYVVTLLTAIGLQ